MAKIFTNVTFIYNNNVVIHSILCRFLCQKYSVFLNTSCNLSSRKGRAIFVHVIQLDRCVTEVRVGSTGMRILMEDGCGNEWL